MFVSKFRKIVCKKYTVFDTRFNLFLVSNSSVILLHTINQYYVQDLLPDERNIL